MYVMSQVQLHPETRNKNSDLVALFQIFCEDRFGRWDMYMQNATFNRMATIYKEKYGNSVFRELVDFVASFENIEIKDILAEFAAFTNKYY